MMNMRVKKRNLMNRLVQEEPQEVMLGHYSVLAQRKIQPTQRKKIKGYQIGSLLLVNLKSAPKENTIAQLIKFVNQNQKERKKKN